MEDTLRALLLKYVIELLLSLNPCFNGRYSQSYKYINKKPSGICLNPCFNGRYSQRSTLFNNQKLRTSLNPCFNGRYSQSCTEKERKSLRKVLILVLMEDTLREKPGFFKRNRGKSLNPCFNGRYSQRSLF